MSDPEIVLPKTPEYWSCDEYHPLETADGICLQLRRYRTAGKDAKYGAVLLMHGASGSHQTFLTPRGGLARYLFCKGFDPWLLDWRSSGLVVDDELKKKDHGTLRSNAAKYNFNDAAKYDIRSALEKMKSEVESSISAMGHCMGSGILAEAIALGHIGPSDVSRIVLETLGLFYEVPIEGQLKTEDRVLERFRHPTGTSALVVDPRMAEKPFKLENAWAAELDKLYTVWPSALKEHVDPPTGETSVSELDALHAMCNRACFMYGMVYEHVNLAPEIHGDATTPGLLQLLFRAIPLQMFIHGANNIRARQATSYDRPGRPNSEYVSDDARDRFRSLMQDDRRVTLITGARNRLWHRDSIDRMYEWLSRGTPVGRRHLVKHVLTEYGHQDLLWGCDSRRDVYELIEKALKP
jgi:pimeloyl-ACP methyl ester carboxylesterase